MPRENLNDLQAFLAAASERSFTRAAGRRSKNSWSKIDEHK